MIYHGSRLQNLKHLRTGSSTKQGSGIYLTTSKEQARYFAEYGSVYTIELLTDNILDFSNETIVYELFNGFHEPLFKQELECIINGSGIIPNLYSLTNKKEELHKVLSKFQGFKIKSLGFKGEFNYIIKDESCIEIKMEESLWRI